MAANRFTPNLTGTGTPAQLKQALGFVPRRQMTAAAGEGIEVDEGSGEISLTDTAVVPASYGNATNVGQFTVDQKGRLTLAANVPISFPADTGITQLTGDVTAGPGSGAQAATLSNTGVGAAAYGSSTAVGTFTVDAKGRLTAAANVAIAFPAPAVGSVTFGTGVPGGTPADGDLYFDDTLATYVGYVGRGGTWHQF